MRAHLEHSMRQKGTHTDLDDVRFHALPHTYAFVAAWAGFSLPMIGALLGYQDAATTACYTHLMNDPVQDDARHVGECLSAALGDNLTLERYWVGYLPEVEER